jgi:hypothetical protein
VGIYDRILYFLQNGEIPFFSKITGSGGEHEGLMSISPPEKRGCVRG